MNIMFPINQEENSIKLNDYLESIKNNLTHKIVFLFDADRTLCEEDTSRLFNEITNIDLSRIKQGFKEYGYTYPAFLANAEIYNELDLEEFLSNCKNVANQIQFYEGIKELFDELFEFADICIITAGLKEIWSQILQFNNVSKIMLIGGIRKEFNDFIIGKIEKGIICDFLKKQNKIVIAFGDSDVDTLMMQKADHAVIVVNHRNNWDLIENLKFHKSLFQISFKDYIHPNIIRTTFKDIIQDIFK